MPNNVGMNPISPVETASNLVGGMALLARMIGVAPPTVYEWKTYKRPVPAGRCVLIEQVTNGWVTRRELRPNDWQKIWPELASTPASRAQAATETVAGGF